MRFILDAFAKMNDFCLYSVKIKALLNILTQLLNKVIYLMYSLWWGKASCLHQELHFQCLNRTTWKEKGRKDGVGGS